MESATPMAASSRSVGPTETPGPVPPVVPTLTVRVRYLLSEHGRKQSLLTGGNGRAVQELTIDLPVNRLHLARVSGNGIAHLKLRPRFDLDGAQRVTRIDAAPMYDVPPTIDELLKDAARNHELERTYHGERSLARAARREGDHEWRSEVAQAFLRDPQRRALVHPAPSPRRCLVVTERGRLRFDIAADVGVAHEVPLEAYRRFTADLQTRRERTSVERAAQLALHEEKRRAVTAWVEAHGTPDQRARHEVDLLPMQEVIDAMAAGAFRDLDDYPAYHHDGAERLQAYLRSFSTYARVVVHREDLVARGRPATMATAAQWALMERIRALMPDATVTLRRYELSWNRDARAPKLATFSVFVTKRIGPIPLRRELAAPDANEVRDVSPELLTA